MENVILYALSFLFIYLVYFLFVIIRLKKKNEYRKSTEVLYLEKFHKVNIDKINLKKLTHVLALANAFIISNVVLVIDFVDNYTIKLLLGFLLIIPMIIIVYYMIAKYYKSKEVK